MTFFSPGCRFQNRFYLHWKLSSKMQFCVHRLWLSRLKAICIVFLHSGMSGRTFSMDFTFWHFYFVNLNEKLHVLCNHNHLNAWQYSWLIWWKWKMCAHQLCDKFSPPQPMMETDTQTDRPTDEKKRQNPRYKLNEMIKYIFVES